MMDCSVLCMLHTCPYINRVGQETREGRTERGREGGGGGGEELKGEGGSERRGKRKSR